MNTRRVALPILGIFAALLFQSLEAVAAESALLDAAAIRQFSLANIAENSLLLGNGDINALLYAGGPGLQLRITKNDVWDARINTANDQPLPTIDVRTRKITGNAGDPPSWGPSYPCPLACAVVGLTSEGAGPAWQQIRGEGKTNTWKYAGHCAVMSIAGTTGASCGWQTSVPDGPACNKIRLRVSGTANARLYITVFNAQGQSFESGWKDTPDSENDVFFDLPAGTVVSRIILYAWTTDGALAGNRYSAIELQGPHGNLALDLSLVTPPPSEYLLDVKHAVAIVPGKTKKNPISVRALADRNVFLIEGDTTVTLQPTTAGFVPKAESGARDGVEYLVQMLPADPGYPDKGDWPGMFFVMAKATRGQRSAISVVTSLESTNALDAAIALAKSTLAEKSATLRKAHENVWNRFWSASQIDLADSYLNNVWYRNLYFMRCVSKAGVKPAGLFAGLIGDSAAWHGDFHLNYNAQQTYWGWYACNHAELSEPYERLIERDLPRAEWFANTTYGCTGAFFPYNVFMHEPTNPATCKSRNGRQMAFIPYTYTLGVAGWAVQNAWLHYQFFPDRQLLQTSVYPQLKGVALFYADFADRCATNPATGKIVFGPSYSPEHWSWGRDDGTCDIAFARMALKAAMESAGRLGVDRDLLPRWQHTLEKLPDYPRTTGAPPVIVDVAGAPPTQYNVPVPALPVYPAGEITWFSPDADKKIFTDTISHMASSGANDLIILAGARARLSMPDAYSWTRSQMLARQRPNGTLSLMPAGGIFNGYGHYTEDFAAAGVITEMLLQSVDNTIRIFPCWPKDKDASFTNLRAQGGFLITAEQKNGKVVKLEVTSTVGGKLRLLHPWTKEIVERKTQPGQKMVFTKEH